jgi:hypothetical protein
MAQGETEIFLAKGPPIAGSSPAIFFTVADADELYEFHRATGVNIPQPIQDRPWGLRDYTVRDLHGHELVFGHPIYNQGPPLVIERVDVPLRLERRLAALLLDLAAHKRMSVDSCLEEILLHTNEGVEPHTQATLRHIRQLNKKHGIDYDTHASYRFVEGKSG